MISELSAVKSKEFNEQQKKYLKKLEDERKELVDSVNKDLSKVGRGAASGVFGYSEAALRKYAKKYMEQLGYEEIVAAVPGLRLDADDVLAEHIVGVEEEFAKKFMMALRGRADALIEVRSRLKDAADELEKKISELEGYGKLKKEELAKTNGAIEKIREALDLINKALSDIDASLQSLSELSGMYGGYLTEKKNYAGFLDYLSKMEREKGYRRPTTYTRTREF
jgi:small-conductance mechanosensitive channel